MLRLLALVPLVGGCGEELGPERFATATVTGRVRIGDRPLGKGWLEFQPTQGTRGHLRSARLAADGSFRVERVPVGCNALRLAGVRLGPTGDALLDAFLAGRFNLGYRVRGPTEDLDLDLRGLRRLLSRSPC
ncbi:MAG: hypothetical protein IRY99_12555 [Isosphaeraceae bacterium]|nr:hypothetical protein [Isosphaeraceae bacterium]